MHTNEPSPGDPPAERNFMELIQLLHAAVERGASDVHLKVGQPPIIRFDGELQPLEGWPPLDTLELEELVREVGASLAPRLATFERTGELDTAYQRPGLPRFRVNAFRQRGDDLVRASASSRARCRASRRCACRPASSGSPRSTAASSSSPAPPAPGKTTTLAAMIGHINRTRRQHIVTIEDPIEILHDDASCIVNQREVGLDTESFHEALRRVLRQDPDVILIGELRDAETAETALQAAESGHLVLSTMHTVDASETVGRLVEFFPAIKQPQVRSILAGVLKGVVSQRLLPRADGGRVAAVEVMVTNSRIQELIRENKPEFIPEAIADGAFFQMQTLSKALIDLVIERRRRRGDRGERGRPNRHDFTDRARPRAEGARGRRRARRRRRPPSPRRRGRSRRTRAAPRTTLRIA